MIKKILLTMLAVSTLSIARNDIPSCYKTLDIEGGGASAQKELFIVVDQTTFLDKKIMIYAYKNMMKFIKNGYRVSIVSFSSNSNGKYTNLEYSGMLEPLLPDSAWHTMAKKKLRKYKSCMDAQHAYAKKKATAALVRVLKGANKKLPHSDIIKSFADIAKHIVKPSNAKEKVILVVSDMMEHSSITSFYANGGLKHLNAKKEMAKISKSGFTADFNGARVYVVGTGMVDKSKYRDSKSLKALTDFWSQYFSRSNAKLVDIGTPMLLEDVK